MAITLAKIAQSIGGKVEGDGSIEITGVAPIENAQAGQITFVGHERYLKLLTSCRASAVIVSEGFAEDVKQSLIRTKSVYSAFLRVLQLFHPEEPAVDEGVHPTAVVGEKTQMGEGVRVGAQVVIGKRVSIGDRTVIMPGTVVEDDVKIGTDCFLHALVCVRNRTVLGNRVIVHSGAVIGSDGFGFAKEDGQYKKIPQVGIVVVEDDVEIGANTTIDRATLGETRIARGAKLDNLIQVAHNCTIGEDTVIAGQAGLSGSTHLGKNVQIGGQVGFGGHTRVGDDAIVGAQAGIIKDVPAGEFVFGSPARPKGEAARILASMPKLPQMAKEIKELKEQIKKLLKERGNHADESEDTGEER